MKKPLTPPKHLTPAAKKWWRTTASEFDLDAHHLHLLTLACEMLDRSADARSIVQTEGAIIRDRFNQSRENPAAKLERDSKITFARLLRELALDIEDPHDTTRPPVITRRQR